MSAMARTLRLREIVEQCNKHGTLPTDSELDLIVDDTRNLFTKDVQDLVLLLVRCLRSELDK